MKRIVLFLATNIAVLLVLSIILKVLGLDPRVCAPGISYGQLLVFSAVVGFTGAIISLLMSKPMAKWSTGAQVITQPRNEIEAWLVATVQRLAQKAGIGMPEVAIYEGEPNAFATGAFKNSALVAVSTGLLQSMNKEEVEAVLAPRGRARRQRRHGHAHADPGRRQHVRHLPRARHRLDRRPRRVQSERGNGPGYFITVIVCADRASASSRR